MVDVYRYAILIYPTPDFSTPEVVRVNQQAVPPPEAPAQTPAAQPPLPRPDPVRASRPANPSRPAWTACYPARRFSKANARSAEVSLRDVPSENVELPTEAAAATPAAPSEVCDARADEKQVAEPGGAAGADPAGVGEAGACAGAVPAGGRVPGGACDSKGMPQGMPGRSPSCDGAWTGLRGADPSRSPHLRRSSGMGSLILRTRTRSPG